MAIWSACCQRLRVVRSGMYSMGLTVHSLRGAIKRLKSHMNELSPRLCELDGQLGDGDLGVTLSKAFNRLDEIAPDLPDDLGDALRIGAQAISKVSSSSFGTLMAVACLTVSKKLTGRTEIPWTEIPDLLDIARDTISMRGKAQLGQKTVIDAIDSAARAMQSLSDPKSMITAALSGVRETIVSVRSKRAEIGRARIFSEKSVGLDDPGMKAFEGMLAALVEKA